MTKTNQLRAELRGLKDAFASLQQEMARLKARLERIDGNKDSANLAARSHLADHL
jgi:hypothetical protein